MICTHISSTHIARRACDTFLPRILALCILIRFNVLCAQTQGRATPTGFDSADVSALNRRAIEQSTMSPSAAMQLARQAQQGAERLGNAMEAARAYNTIGVLFRFQDVYDSSLWYHSKALAIFEKTRDLHGKAETLLNIGGVYQSRADFLSALEYHLQALPLYESLKDTAGIARALANIGIVHTARGAFEEARTAHRRSLKLRELLQDNRALAHAWRNLGSVYLAEGRINKVFTDTALGMYRSALAVFERAGDKQGVSLSYTSIGAALQQIKEYQKALQYQRKAISLLEQLGDRRGLAVLFNTIASTENALGHHNHALEYANRALAIGDSIGAAAEQCDAHKMRSEAFAGLGNSAAAFEAFRRFTVLNDSLFTLKSTQQVAMLQMRYELAKKEKELLHAEQERSIEALRVRGLWGVLALATVLFVVVVLFVNNRYRLKNEAAKKLAEQNAEIVQQREMLRYQAEEIRRSNETLHEVNEQLAAQNAMLTELNNEKNEILGIAAHDLKNPLSNILLTTQLIDAHEDDLPMSKQQDLTASITRSVEYMLNIITNLLNVNKIESGKIELQMEPVEVSVVKMIAETFRYAAAAKDITLVVAPVPPAVSFLADRNAFQQIVENLLSNALKFSPRGKTVFVRVRPYSPSVIDDFPSDGSNQPTSNSKSNHQASGGQCIRMEVQDEGPGVSAEDQKKLFGKFARLSARPTGGEHSTGLGLSIVKKLVEAMDGRVWCESEIGNGATFVVELPLAPTTQRAKIG